MRTSYFFILSFLIGISLNIHSQVRNIHSQINFIDSEAQKEKATFQIRGGLNVSYVGFSHNHNHSSSDPKLGFNIGAIVDIPVKDNFYVQTGAIFTSKGAKVDEIDVEGVGKIGATMSAMYIQVPFYLTFKLNIHNNNKFNIGFGPYFAYGVAGKNSFSTGNNNFDIGDNAFGDNALWNRPDLGIGVEVQFEIDRIVFIFGADGSLVDAWKRDYLIEGLKVKNNNVYVSFGFKF